MEQKEGLSVAKRRGVASSALSQIASCGCLQGLPENSVNRLAREAMLSILFMEFNPSNSVEATIGTDRIRRLSCYDDEEMQLLLQRLIIEIEQQDGNSIKSTISGLIVNWPKDPIRSLAETMSIHEITMDMVIQTDSGITERREQGIHYTPWDLAIWMAGRIPARTVSKRVLDPAMGCGVFLMACRKTLGKRVTLFGGDIDPVAVFSTRMQMTHVLGNEASEKEIIERFRIADFLSDDGKETWSSENLDSVIMNPPYVVQSIDESFKTSKAKNLAAFFIERSFEVLGQSGQIVAVVPITMATGGPQYDSVRRLILDSSSSVSIKNIDVVPGYLFSQGKFEGKGSSRSVSARVSIFDVEIGHPPPLFSSTRFIRWKTEQRGEMMGIDPDEVDAAANPLFTESCFPMGSRSDLGLLYRLLNSSEESIGTVSSKSGNFYLQVLKPARYHFSADSNISDRKNTIVLGFEEKDHRDAAMAIIVSNAFFWFWRCHGNGVQIRTKELESFPWPTKSVDALSGIGRELSSMSDEENFQVRSSNMGNFSSPAFRMVDQIRDADRAITEALLGDGVDYSDFFESTRHPDATYSIAPSLSASGENVRTTPKAEREAVYSLVKSNLEAISEEEDHFMSMQEMYDLVEKTHRNEDEEFELTPIQLSLHKQRSGPIEPNYKHDLKNSLSNGKRKGEVICPYRDSWGWPRPPDWESEIHDAIHWEEMVERASEMAGTTNDGFEIISVGEGEIVVCRPGRESRHAISEDLVDAKVRHLINCGGLMDSKALHAYTDVRDAIIELHPKVEFLKTSNRKRIRFLR